MEISCWQQLTVMAVPLRPKWNSNSYRWTTLGYGSTWFGFDLYQSPVDQLKENGAPVRGPGGGGGGGMLEDNGLTSRIRMLSLHFISWQREGHRAFQKLIFPWKSTNALTCLSIIGYNLNVHGVLTLMSVAVIDNNEACPVGPACLTPLIADRWSNTIRHESNAPI